MAESQLWNLLTPREKVKAFDLAEEKKCDLMEVVKYLNKELKDDKGKPFIKDSRIETIRRNFKPYKQIYDKNRSNEDFANWYYENALLGYTHGKYLRKVSSEYSHLESIETALGKTENSKVNFIATVEDTYSAKSRKGTPYLRLTIQDETGVCTAMIFTQKNRDNIANCRRDNGGTLPIKKGIVIVKGVKKDGDTIFADLVITQDSISGESTSGVPLIDTNELETQVIVKNGETVVLGGIFQSEDVRSETKTPFLGDIPYIGRLFKRTSVRQAKTELMIFITPRILSDTLVE